MLSNILPDISVTELKEGDIIVEGVGRSRTETKVRKVEHNACSSKGTHVNGNECYDRIALVNLKLQQEKAEAHLLEDWPIDRVSMNMTAAEVVRALVIGSDSGILTQAEMREMIGF